LYQNDGSQLGGRELDKLFTLLKMDVEGSEAEALAGMRETIRRDRPPIFVVVVKMLRDGSSLCRNKLTSQP